MDFIAPALAKVYTTVRVEKGERAFNVIYIPWTSNADDADDADDADAADAVADAGSEHAEGGGGSGGAAAAEQTLDATKEAELRAKPVNKIINLLAQNVLENTVLLEDIAVLPSSLC